MGYFINALWHTYFLKVQNKVFPIKLVFAIMILYCMLFKGRVEIHDVVYSIERKSTLNKMWSVNYILTGQEMMSDPGSSFCAKTLACRVSSVRPWPARHHASQRGVSPKDLSLRTKFAGCGQKHHPAQRCTLHTLHCRTTLYCLLKNTYQKPFIDGSIKAMEAQWRTYSGVAL